MSPHDRKGPANASGPDEDPDEGASKPDPARPRDKKSSQALHLEASALAALLGSEDERPSRAPASRGEEEEGGES